MSVSDENQRSALGDAEELLHQLEHVDQHMVLELVNDFLIVFWNVYGESNLFCQVHPDPAVRATAEGYRREAMRLRTQLLQSPRVFQLLGSLEESQLEPLAWRAATLTRRDMLRFGVNLSDADRDRVRALRDELTELEQAFARNIRDDVRNIQLSGADALDGLPADYVASHPPGPDGQVHVSTSYPDYYPFMNYARNEAARLALVHEFYNRAVPSNLQVLRRMLEVRHQVATLLGFTNWADYLTEDVMVGSASKAAAFLDRVHQAAHPGVQAELAELLEIQAPRQLICAENRFVGVAVLPTAG
jgi:thimet oligopeptidase